MKKKRSCRESPVQVQKSGLTGKNESSLDLKEPVQPLPYSRERHNLKISMALREYQRRKKAGIPTKPRIRNLDAAPESRTYPRCACGLQFATKDDLDIHSFFCEALKQKRKNYNREV